MSLRGYEGTAVHAQFVAALKRRRIVPPPKLIADARIHRCHVAGKHGKGDAAYLLHLDGAVPAGGLQNFKDGLGWEKWSADIGRKLSFAEDRDKEAKFEAARRELDAEEARWEAKAKEKAARLLNAASPCDGHPYLMEKSIAAHGLKTLYGSLVVPMRDADGGLHNLQLISKDGSERFLKGGRVEGCFFLIGDYADTICVAEGFATAASIHAATTYTVAVAFNANNLLPVAEAMRQKLPTAKIIVCADDDYKTKGNPGQAKAIAAARAVDALVAVPEFGQNRRERDTDFNDLHASLGIEAVRGCIEAAMTVDDVLVRGAKADPSTAFV